MRGLGLRFRMLGGSYRIVIRGQGISLSAVGRGNVSIDGEPKFLGDDLGLYSVDSDVDCGIEPQNCTRHPGRAGPVEARGARRRQSGQKATDAG